MMTYSECLLRLCERYSGLLYTARTLDNALTSLKEDRLRAGRSPSQREKRPPFVAFSRSRVFWYAPLFRPIRFVLNGSRLAQRYTLVPFALPDFEKGTRHFQYELYVAKDIAPLSRYLVALELSTKSLFTAQEVRATIASLRRYTSVPIYVHGRRATEDPEDLDVDDLLGLGATTEPQLTADYHRFLEPIGSGHAPRNSR